MRSSLRTVMQPWRNERGVVLPLALMALLVLGTVSAALLTVGSSEVQIAANHRGAVQAQFLAEAGLERAFAQFLAAGQVPQGNQVLFQPTALGSGNYTVRTEPAGANTVLVVSTGATTSGAQRVLRAIITATDQFPFDQAIMAGPGRKDLRAQNRVEGTCGNVHSNGDLNVGGYVKGSGTASGKFETIGDGKVDGDSGGGRPKKKIPAIDPAAFRAKALLSVPKNQIYQLKSDGRMLDGNDNQIAKLKTSDKPHNPTGWAYDGDGWSQKTHDYFAPGTYYVEGNARLQEGNGNVGNEWKITVIATGMIDFVSSSSPALTPHLPGVLFVAGRDIKIHGGGVTFNINKPGLIAAHGKVWIHQSKVTILGAIVEEGVSTSFGDLTEMGGTIIYNCGLSLPSPQKSAQILAWGP